MKLAEALILRADIQNRREQLRSRMKASALVQEGEKPAEDPMDLIKELDQLTVQLEELMTKINLTNAITKHEGKSITEMLAKRDCLSWKISILQSMLETAGNTVMRGSRMEVKIFSTIPVAELRKSVDSLSKELRELDMTIQSVNWTTELQ